MLVSRRAPVPLLRLVSATAVLGLAGAALAALAPGPVASARSLGGLQHLVDTAGPDVVVVRVAGLLAWLVWAWGSLGLALTATGQLPGAAGALARGLLRLAVPAAARRAAAVALGLGIGLNGTVLAGTALAAPAPAATAATTTATAAATTTPGAPDWPDASPAAATADRPGAPAGTHVVVRGDCLWRLARAALPVDAGDARVAGAVQQWWRANAEVIGPDPDRLLPGQVLHAPDTASGGDR